MLGGGTHYRPSWRESYNTAAQSRQCGALTEAIGGGTYFDATRGFYLKKFYAGAAGCHFYCRIHVTCANAPPLWLRIGADAG